MKNTKKIVALILALSMISSLSLSAYANSTVTPKEEVIYIITDANGNVNTINAVNIFGTGDVIDYGDYTAVKMLTTNDKIIQDNDKITFTSNTDKVYYQGTINEKQIPWNISIRYFLDGIEYSQAEIAGKTGALEIHFNISKNEKCNGDFYENYALQSTFLLDTNKCINIVADDATIANVGSDKQLTYTILAGRGIDTVIKADVTDFEMDAVSINGIQLNLSIDIDDEILLEKVSELMDATKKIGDGSNELNTGVSELQNGAKSLKDGASALNSGASELDNGIASLKTGIDTVQSGLNTLNKQSETLTSGSSQIKTALKTIQTNLNNVSMQADELSTLTNASNSIKKGIDDLYIGVQKLQKSLDYNQYKSLMNSNGLDIDVLKAGNEKTISELSSQITELKSSLSKIQGVTGYENTVKELKTQIANLENIVTLLKGNNASITGTETYINTVSAGVTDLSNGIKELKNQYTKFDLAISNLVKKLSDTVINMSSLSDGINTLVVKYSELDTGIIEYTNGVASLVSGYKMITDGAENLALGSKNLLSATNELSSGADELYDGVVKLYEGLAELSSGANGLNSKTSDMDVQIEEQIDCMLSAISGGNTELKSFVSDKNKNVKSVQFVIKTSAIEKATVAEDVITETVKLTFWQKLLKLFGLYKGN